MSRTPILAGVATAVLLEFSLPAGTSAGIEQVTVKKFQIRPVASVAGKDMYREYCARCHGENGKGAGPQATGLRIPPADLTTIAQRNGGSFNTGGVIDKINGLQQVPRTLREYSERERALQTGEHIENAPVMPIWGPPFAKMYPDRSERTMRLMNLANYLKSIQEKK